MLILTRRLGENIVIGDDIVISVMEVRGDAVRLGIQAPRSVTVHREEVYLELQRANKAAAQSGARDDAVAAMAQNLGSGSSQARAAQPDSNRPDSDQPGGNGSGSDPGSQSQATAGPDETQPGQ